MGTSERYRPSIVSSFSGVLYGPLFYRHLEIDKIRHNKGNYSAHVRLSQESVSEIKWWYDSIPTAHYPILLPNSKVDGIILMHPLKDGEQSKIPRKQSVDGQMKRQIPHQLFGADGLIVWT